MEETLQAKEKNALLRMKKEISEKYRLRWVKLFGSKARGDFEEESDLDVVIVLSDDMSWVIEKDIYEICFYAGLEYDTVISPVIYSEREINDKFIRATPFYRVVEKEGVEI